MCLAPEVPQKHVSCRLHACVQIRKLLAHACPVIPGMYFGVRH